MKGLKGGLKYLAVLMAVLMVFATGAFVTTEPFHAADENDENAREYVDTELKSEETQILDGDYYGGEYDYEELEEYLEDDDEYDIESGYGSEEVYDEAYEEWDDEDDEDVEDDSDEDEYKAAGSLEKTIDNGITISASYDEGIFTEKVKMNASAVASDKILPKLPEVIDGALGAVGVDISFNDEDEEIWALDGNEVSFTISIEELPEGQDHYLVHIDDEGVAVKLSAKVEDKAVSFKTDSFGTYAIVGVGEASEQEKAEETQEEEQTIATQEQQPVAESVPGVHQVQVAALNGTKVYDGESVDTSELVSAVIVDGNVINEYSMSDGGLSFSYEGKEFLVPGVSVSADGDIRDVGHYDIVVSGGGTTVASTTDPSVTCQVTAMDGSYEVVRREIVLTSASGEWRYDGKAHKAAKVAVSGDGWLDGDAPDYYFTNSQKEIGQTENYFVMKKDSAGKITDWASEYPNYNIVVAYGVLRVDPAK